jgi:mannosyltransferase OCH1-like enzyme
MNIIHQVYLNGEPEGKFKELHEKLRESAGQITVMLWDDDSCRKMANELGLGNLYSKYPHWIYRQDIARVMAIYKYGGWYIDMDTELYKNPMDIAGSSKFAAITHPRPLSRYDFSIFYAGEPKSPVLQYYLDNLAERANAGSPIIATGSHLFDEAVNRNRNDIVFLPEKIFYGTTSLDRKGTYGTHLELKSWSDKGPFVRSDN